MAKCVDCRLCLTFTWIDDVRYLKCDLCGKLYKIEEGKLVEYTVPKKKVKLPIDKKTKW